MDIKNVKVLHKYIKEILKKNQRLIIKTGDIDGFTPPSVLVGQRGYPMVSIGILFSNDQNSHLYDNPKNWIINNYDVLKIFSLKSTLINAKMNFNIREVSNQKLEDIRLATLSKTDVMIKLNVSKVYQSDLYKNVKIDSLKLNDNIKIDEPIEKVYYDKDLKAEDGVVFLYKNKIDENKINKMMSVGAIGVERKIVPTKWSITAVDDIITKNLIESIKLYDTDKFGVIHGGILGNIFTFLLIPGKWAFELIEIWNNKGRLFIGGGDYELYYGRKGYAKNTAGGYYAARLAVTEKLNEIRKQYSVIAVREITPEYILPLGVWVVRESARNALKNQIVYFEDMNKAIDYMNQTMLYIKDIKSYSRLLNIIKTQRTLNEF